MIDDAVNRFGKWINPQENPAEEDINGVPIEEVHCPCCHQDGSICTHDHCYGGKYGPKDSTISKASGSKSNKHGMA